MYLILTRLYRTCSTEDENGEDALGSFYLCRRFLPSDYEQTKEGRTEGLLELATSVASRGWGRRSVTLWTRGVCMCYTERGDRNT
jgi:hypothetical protein